VVDESSFGINEKMKPVSTRVPADPSKNESGSTGRPRFFHFVELPQHVPDRGFDICDHGNLSAVMVLSKTDFGEPCRHMAMGNVDQTFNSRWRVFRVRLCREVACSGDV